MIFKNNSTSLCELFYNECNDKQLYYNDICNMFNQADKVICITNEKTY